MVIDVGLLVRELWSELNEFYSPSVISGERSAYYKNILEEALGSNITVIDDPYHAVKGITLYKILTGTLTSKRYRGINRQVFVSHWERVFNGIPRVFSEFQVQLISLWIYAYYHLYDESERKGVLDIKGLHNMLRKLYEFSTSWLLSLDRSHLFLYYAFIPMDEYYKLSKKDRKSSYKALSEVHDFISTCGLITTIAPTIHRRLHFTRASGERRAKLEPGKAYDVIITLPGIHVVKKFEEVEITGLSPREIYDVLSPLVKYYQELFRIAREKINESLSRYRESGVSLIDTVGYEAYLPASIIEEVEPQVRSFILRHEVASMVLWLATAMNLRVDFGSFTRGLLRVVGGM